MESHFQSLKELQEIRNICVHTSKKCMNDDTPMCECHEANYVQHGGYQNQNSHDQYSHLSHNEQPQSNNDYEKSLTELNNEKNRDFEDFRRYWCNRRTVIYSIYAQLDLQLESWDEAFFTRSMKSSAYNLDFSLLRLDHFLSFWSCYIQPQVRIFAFLYGPPDYGPRQLDTRRYGDQYASRGEDNELALLPEQTPFYKDLAVVAVQAGVCMDILVVTNEYTDLASLKFLSIDSGGSLSLYPNTDDATLPQAIYQMLSRPYAFNCVM
ncbi:sec23/sec24 transport family protein [Artemisia annua]|uniref:Sec23/sec24 transport family protein n=1 Tax=Artemisia annua TaxID=35608 RepID=A0A2U1KAN1_ARTAN|nr:sec23/sec24 transport family protein [Artemisia annua]